MILKTGADQPVDRKLDITNIVAVYARTSDEFQLKLVARNMSGNPIAFSDLPIGNIVIIE